MFAGFHLEHFRIRSSPDALFMSRFETNNWNVYPVLSYNSPCIMNALLSTQSRSHKQRVTNTLWGQCVIGVEGSSPICIGAYAGEKYTTFVFIPHFSLT